VSASNFAGILTTGIVAGIFGAIALELTMWLITRSGWAKGDMIVALGSFLTKSRANAWRVGAVVHATAAIIYAISYTLLMVKLGLTTMPGAFTFGLGVGFVHGMVVSLGLVWVVAESHPLEEFKEADLAIGVSHLAAHVAFGGMVGLVVGLAPL
jgi:hypothetical protein